MCHFEYCKFYYLYKGCMCLQIKSHCEVMYVKILTCSILGGKPWFNSRDKSTTLYCILVITLSLPRKVSFNAKALSFKKKCLVWPQKKDNNNDKPHQSKNYLDLIIIKKWICSIKLHKTIVFVVNDFMHCMFKPL